jgi:Uma2 family endonuclease
VPEPDLAVVRGTVRDFTKRHPATAELVVEVAVTSVREDREMCEVYARAGVAEYWIVIAQEQRIEVYRRPEDGAYREMAPYSQAAELACGSIPQLRFHVSELFADTTGT